MELFVEGNQERVVARVTGDIVAETADELIDAMAGMTGRAREVVLDLADVPFMDSRGISALLVIRMRCQRQKTEFCLTNPQPRVKRILDAARLSPMFGL